MNPYDHVCFYAGKSGGEFYTPQEVSELLAKITTVGKKEVNKVYDQLVGQVHFS
jgi:type I restriction enzyme M protein